MFVRSKWQPPTNNDAIFGWLGGNFSFLLASVSILELRWCFFGWVEAGCLAIVEFFICSSGANDNCRPTMMLFSGDFWCISVFNQYVNVKATSGCDYQTLLAILGLVEAFFFAVVDFVLCSFPQRNNNWLTTMPCLLVFKKFHFILIIAMGVFVWFIFCVYHLSA